MAVSVMRQSKEKISWAFTNTLKESQFGLEKINVRDVKNVQLPTLSRADTLKTTGTTVKNSTTTGCRSFIRPWNNFL